MRVGPSAAWRWGWTAAGVVAAAAGLAYDLTADTSTNNELDGGDFVGPAGYVLGVSFGLVGWFFYPTPQPE